MSQTTTNSLSLSLSSYAKPRQSGLEPLRVVAVLLILIRHANWVNYGVPTPADLAAHPAQTIVSTLLEYTTLLAVNVFVLISGWFSIRLRPKGVWTLLFQSSFYKIAVLIGLVAFGVMSFSLDNVLKSIAPLYYPDGWFIPAYLGLMLLSPALNALAEKYSERLGGYLIFCYGLLLVIGVPMNVNRGYSMLSFLFLYLIGRWLRQRQWNRSGGYYMLIAFGYIILGAMIFLIALILFPSLSASGRMEDLSAYSTPWVILSSMYFFLAFTRLHFTSRLVNWLAASSLAVYLIHCSGWVIDYYKAGVRALWGESLALSLLQIVGYLVAIFVGSILVDKVRLLVWQRLVLPLYDRLVRGWLRRGLPLPKLPS